MKTPLPFACLLALLICQPAYAGPIRDVVEGTVEGAEKAVGYAGKTVVDTTKAVGKSVDNSASRITGNVDPVAARSEVDAMTSRSLDRLFKADPKAKSLFERSYGYAVFDSRKTSFLFTVGRGAGVAVNKENGERTYMQMAAAGANLGAGLKFYQNIFLFEDKETFEKFVNRGWEAGTSGGATFGRDSLEAEVRFINGLAVYQLSDAGIMLSADVTGTKYWKDGTLNG